MCAAQAVPEGIDGERPPTAVEALVTVLFTAAIAALSIVTAGIAYLGVSQWLDTRQDNKDKKIFEADLKSQYASQHFDTLLCAFKCA